MWTSRQTRVATGPCYISCLIVSPAPRLPTSLTWITASENSLSAALSVIRVCLGASDFSASAYSLADDWDDTDLRSFNLNNSPSYLWSTLYDIKSIVPHLKIMVVPWSAPAWMKDSSSLYGGSLKLGYETICKRYLFVIDWL